MRPVLRRIAIHGGLTAIVLGIAGLMFAELASIWMAVSLATKTNNSAQTAPPDPAVLRSRLPLTMAAFGFAFVAVGELLLHLLRRNRTVRIVPSPPIPDSTEKLLEELLSQAEAKIDKVPAKEAGSAQPLVENNPKPATGNTSTSGEK